MKQKIRLTESQLHNVIKESVKRVLKEMSDDTVRFFANRAFKTSLNSGLSEPRRKKYIYNIDVC